MKVVLSDKAYLKPDAELSKRFNTHLVYETQGTYANAPPKFTRNWGPILRGNCWIPVERLDLLQGYDYEIIDKRVLVPTEIPEPFFDLRQDQLEAAEAIIATGSGLLNGAPGWGKTICALYMAYRLGQKTLVVCTTTAIRDMWAAEVVKWMDFEPGIVGSGSNDVSQCITIGNIQTLTRNAEKYKSEFGLIIFDEAHHTAASTFTKLLLSNKARYKIGLSGTLYRKDGLHVVFKDFFGMNIVSPAINNTINPIVHRYQSACALPGTMEDPWADRVTHLCNNIVYRKELIVLSKLYVKLGHKLIVVSDRIELLTFLSENCGLRSALFIGDAGLDERNSILKQMTDGELDVIYASQALFSEGLSQNNLSAMILASPISDNRSLISQLGGRIMRLMEGKEDPILVDMMLTGGSGKNQARKRRAIYAILGWKILGVDLHYLLDAGAKFIESKR